MSMNFSPKIVFGRTTTSASSGTWKSGFHVQRDAGLAVDQLDAGHLAHVDAPVL